MDSPYQRIAHLFGAPRFEGDAPKALPRKKKGSSADESRELGQQSLNEGDYETAIKHFTAAIQQRESGNVGDWIDLASAYECAEMAPQALRQYERALRIQQDAPEPHLGLSQI